ncbi:MAG: cell division protein FtsZ [Mycoplasmoidaceae bacterium]
MSNKNLDKILNSTEDLEIKPIKNIERNNNSYNNRPYVNRPYEDRNQFHTQPAKNDENDLQASKVINIDKEQPTPTPTPSKPNYEIDMSFEDEMDSIEDDAIESVKIGRGEPQKITITKNVGRIFEVSNDAIIQTMGDGRIFTKDFKVKIIGIGGAGNNIIKYVYNSRTWPSFVEIKALNTDYVALKNIPELAGSLLLMGSDELKGNGSGGDPEMGKRAAESDAEEIKKVLEGTDILVLVAGLGKGTGTGATPIIAQIAKELGILTIGLFNLPSIGAEGNKTYSNALSGLDKLSYICSGFTTVSNDRIIGSDRERTSIKKAYEDANEYMRVIIDEFINIITNASDVNVDFADIRNFFKSQNGFLFVKVDISDYTKDSIKEAIEEKIEKGYTDIDIIDSQNAIFNFKINENVPSSILENARSATKEIVKTNDLNIIHGISFSDKYENAEINILLAGKFELGKIIDNSSEEIKNISSKTQLFSKTEDLLEKDIFADTKIIEESKSGGKSDSGSSPTQFINERESKPKDKYTQPKKKKWWQKKSENTAPTSKFLDLDDKDY